MPLIAQKSEKLKSFPRNQSRYRFSIRIFGDFICFFIQEFIHTYKYMSYSLSTYTSLFVRDYAHIFTVLHLTLLCNSFFRLRQSPRTLRHNWKSIFFYFFLRCFDLPLVIARLIMQRLYVTSSFDVTSRNEIYFIFSFYHQILTLILKFSAICDLIKYLYLSSKNFNSSRETCIEEAC